MDFFGIGPWEILLIIIVALIVVGPGKIPEIARTLGKTIRAVRKASAELTTAVTRELEAAGKEDTPPPKQAGSPASQKAGNTTAEKASIPASEKPVSSAAGEALLPAPPAETGSQGDQPGKSGGAPPAR